MRTVLHILTRPEDEVTKTLLAEEQARNDLAVEVVRLDGPAPDYDALVERILAADSVQVS